jgi:benzoyl-CoA reductase/2-hydroxyglutaryl-CoA dehydratase subunit BcrC/BadD/HgdB
MHLQNYYTGGYNMEELIKDIIRLHDERFQQLKNEDAPKINWLSICTPEEIIYAANMIPYRITGETRTNFQKAGAYMHLNICPYVLSCLEEKLDGVHDFSSGTVIVNACDVRRRLYDVWKYYDNSTFLHLLDFPKVLNPVTKSYFKKQLQQLIQSIEMHFHRRITGEALKEAIHLCNETRLLLTGLYGLRKEGKAPITASQALNIIKAGMTGLRKEFNQKLSLLISHIKNNNNTCNQKKYRLLLCGSYFDHTEISDIFEENGASIVCEAVSTGVKYFEGQVDPEGDPIDALADYYLEKTICARMIDSEKRFNHIWNLVENYDIQAVIYFTLKFCDNNLFDFPYQKKKLNERGIPIFLIEAERSIENIEQLKTRIIAFLESRIGY